MTSSPQIHPDPQKRILISGGLAVGGPQTHITILCKVLREAGADVTIAAAATNWTPSEVASLKASGVRLIVSRFGFGRWKFFGKLYSFLIWPFLLRRDYEVLYCIGEGKMHLWAKHFVREGAKIIYHEIVECPKPDSVAARVASKMSHLIGNSRLVARKMARHWPDIPVTTLPFLTSTVETPIPGPKTFAGNHILRIAFLGRMISHKRPDRLIEEWTSLNRLPMFMPARLDLYGGDYDTAMVEHLRRRVVESGLQDQIHLHGHYPSDALPAILAKTDVVVLPSLYEGLPLVLVEAMLRGIPIVSTSAGGCEELGESNPDVVITPGTSWDAFLEGLGEMVAKMRSGGIDGIRLHAWTEERYGYRAVSYLWRQALLTPIS